jgi:AcrR family transcriptional regulator
MRADRHTRLTGALAPNGSAAHTVTSRARRQAETRTALLDAAERLFGRDGYAVTSLERIAAEAGFTKGAIYANFASKEALFLALQERRSCTLGNHWAAELPASASLEVQARAISEHLGRLFARQRPWALVAAEFWALAARRPALAKALRDLHARDRAEIGRLIRRALPDGAVPDDTVRDELARQTIALLDGLAIDASVDPEVDFVSVFSRAFTALVSSARQ